MENLGALTVGSQRYNVTSPYASAGNPQLTVLKRTDLRWLKEQSLAMLKLVSYSYTEALTESIPSERYRYSSVVPAWLYADAKAVMLRSEEIYRSLEHTSEANTYMTQIRDWFDGLTNRYNVYMDRSDLVAKEDLIKVDENVIVKDHAIDNMYQFYQALPDAVKVQLGIIRIFDKPDSPYAGHTFGNDGIIYMNNLGFKGGVIDPEKGQFTYETFVLAHELGHIIDAQSLDGGQQYSNQPVFGPLWQERFRHDPQNYFSDPYEAFAETYGYYVAHKIVLLPYEQVENIVAYGDQHLTAILGSATVSGDGIKNPFAGATNADQAHQEWFADPNHKRITEQVTTSKLVPFQNVDELGNVLLDTTGYRQISEGVDGSIEILEQSLYFYNKLVDKVISEQKKEAINVVYTKIIIPEPTVTTTSIPYQTRYLADETLPFGYERTLEGSEGISTITTTYAINPETNEIVDTVGQPVVIAPKDKIVLKGTQAKREQIHPTVAPTLYIADPNSEQKAGTILTTRQGTDGYTERTTTYQMATDGTITPVSTEKIIAPIAQWITISTKPQSTTSTQAYPVRYVEDAHQLVGYLTETGGLNGTTTILTTYILDPVTGHLTALQSEPTVIDPIEKIITKGTKIATEEPKDAGCQPSLPAKEKAVTKSPLLASNKKEGIHQVSLPQISRPHRKPSAMPVADLHLAAKPAQTTAATRQAAQHLPDTGQVDHLTPLGFVFALIGLGFWKKKKSEVEH